MYACMYACMYVCIYTYTLALVTHMNVRYLRTCICMLNMCGSGLL